MPVLSWGYIVENPGPHGTTGGIWPRTFTAAHSTGPESAAWLIMQGKATVAFAGHRVVLQLALEQNPRRPMVRRAVWHDAVSRPVDAV